MALHYLRESDQPRPCSGSDSPCETLIGTVMGREPCIRAKGHLGHCAPDHRHCPDCNGTGQLGNPGAPRVETWNEQGDYQSMDSWGWYAELQLEDSGMFGPYPTEAEALAAARKAAGVES